MRVLLTCLFVLAALLASVEPALAQRGSADIIAKAQQHYNKATRYQEQRRYLRAAKEYLRAHELYAQPFLLYNAGRMFWEAKRRPKAVKLFRRYLDQNPQGHDARGVRTARRLIDEYVINLQHIAKSYEASGQWKEAADVFLEAYEVSKQPDWLYHAGTLCAANGDRERATSSLNRYLQAAPGGKYAANARSILATPDKRPEPTSPPAPPAVDPSASPADDPSESLTVDLPVSPTGDLPVSPAGDLPVSPTGDASAPSSPTRERRWAWWVPVAVSGAGALLLTGAVTLHVQSAGEFSALNKEYMENCPDLCTKDEVRMGFLDDLDAANSKQTLAQIGYGLAGATLAAGALLLYLNRARPVETARPDDAQPDDGHARDASRPPRLPRLIVTPYLSRDAVGGYATLRF